MLRFMLIHCCFIACFFISCPVDVPSNGARPADNLFWGLAKERSSKEAEKMELLWSF